MAVMSEPNRTRYAVLGALFTLGPSSGYAIRQGLETTVAHFWHESFGQIYPVLATLEREGLVALVNDTGVGRRPRRIWELTATGHAALTAWLEAPVERAGRPRNELLLKLFFAAAWPPKAACGLIVAHRAAAESQIAVYRGIEAEIGREVPPDPAQPFWLATVRYGLLTAEAILAWCDETLARLAAISPPATHRAAR
jgi:PadR family transcriptional regulator, regulatory protein AphA